MRSHQPRTTSSSLRVPSVLALGLALVCGAGGCAGSVGDGAAEQEKEGGGGSAGGKGGSRPSTGGSGATVGQGSGGSTGGKGGSGSSMPPGGSGGPDLPMPPPVVGGAPPSVSACKSPGRPGPRVLRRLSAAELNETLKELFGTSKAPQANVLNDPEILGFRNDAARLLVQDLVGQQLLDFAGETATWAAANRMHVLSPSCMTNDAACRKGFLQKFGRKAFRRPLTDAEITTYDGLMAAQGTWTEAVETAITAMMGSPYFLYRSELGKPDPAKPGTYLLTPHEIATELSYLIVGSMPDSALLAAADAGELSTPAQIDAQVDRLLKDPRSADAIMRFVTGWLELEKLETNVKDDTILKLTPELKHDMMGETRALVMDTFTRGGTVADLLTSPHTFINKSLAGLYGLPGGSDQMTKTLLPPAQRDPGILAHGSVLAAHATPATSSPIRRGKLVRTRLLCQSIPDPPGDIDTMLKPSKPNATTRERFAAHRENPQCAACHALIDPIGNGFERYDAFGRKRDTDNGQPVDSKGALVGLSTADVPFDGVKELGALLAKTEDVKSCVVRYWSYFAFGQASWEEDACTLESIKNEADKNGFTLRSVVMGIVHAPHFTRRVQDK